MAIIETRDSPVFNAEEIHERDLVRAKYHTWTEPRNGLVVTVEDNLLTVIFLPAINRATCYFTIKAQEVLDQKWEILYTTDMETIGRVGSENGGIGEPDTEAVDDEL